jgi:hypothetical protein
MSHYNGAPTSRFGLPREKTFILVATAYIIMLCASTPGNPANAASIIDETMPASISDSIIADWKLQDSVGSDYSVAIQKIRSKLPEKYAVGIPDSTSEAAYLTACHWRRVARIAPYTQELKKIVYARHHDIGDRGIG